MHTTEFGEKKMKKLTLALSIIFIILTFLGAGYVLVNHGEVNAGYACVPMVLALAFISFISFYQTQLVEELYKI